MDSLKKTVHSVSHNLSRLARRRCTTPVAAWEGAKASGIAGSDQDPGPAARALRRCMSEEPRAFDSLLPCGEAVGSAAGAGAHEAPGEEAAAAPEKSEERAPSADEGVSSLPGAIVLKPCAARAEAEARPMPRSSPGAEPLAAPCGRSGERSRTAATRVLQRLPVSPRTTPRVETPSAPPAVTAWRDDDGEDEEDGDHEERVGGVIGKDLSCGGFVERADSLTLSEDAESDGEPAPRRRPPLPPGDLALHVDVRRIPARRKMDGRWFLRSDTGGRPSRWLHSLTIDGDMVVDGNGRICEITRSPRGPELCGGFLQRRGATLLRFGRSGGIQVYVRVPA